LGRFVGGFITEKLGYFKSIIYTSTLTVITYTIGLLLKENGLYDQVTIMIGGAPVTDTYAEEIGANYSPDASSAVDLANDLLGR